MVPAVGFPTGRLSILNYRSAPPPSGRGTLFASLYFSASELRSTGTPGPIVEASATFWT
jgi:hypothetical protein